MRNKRSPFVLNPPTGREPNRGVEENIGTPEIERVTEVESALVRMAGIADDICCTASCTNVRAVETASL